MRFFIRRLLLILPTIWGVVTIVFFLLHLTPGDPVEIMLGENSLPADRAALRHQLGLDKPLLTQYVTYLENLVHLDLGESIFYREKVTTIIERRFPATLSLALFSMIVAMILAIPPGIYAAVKKYSAWDNITAVISLIGVSIPNFFLGPLLILIFALKLGWLPVSGKSDLSSYILPSITLGTSLAAILTRITRTSLISALNQPYIRTARAKGLPETRVIIRHGLRNALIPIVTIMGLQFGALLSGAVITETIFSWPGIGRLLIDAISTRDYPLVQGTVLVIALSYILVNTIVDLTYSLIDPRVRLSR